MGSVFFAIAAGAINFVVLPVVQIGRVQRTVAIATVETATMPHLYRRNFSVSNKLKIAWNTQVTYSVLANHLLGGVDGESATRTAFTLRGFQTRLGFTGRFRFARSTDQSWGVSVTETFRSPPFAVASLAINILVGAVASQDRIQRSVAVGAVEAQFVPFLFKYRTDSTLEINQFIDMEQTCPLESICSAAKTLPPQRGQPCPSGALIDLVSIDLNALSIPFLFHIKTYNENDVRFPKNGILRNRVAHQEGGTATESVAFRAEFLGVAKLAVDIAVWPVAGQHRVQHAMALFAVEASLVPHLINSQIVFLQIFKLYRAYNSKYRSTSQHLFGGENGSTAPRASILAFNGLNDSQIRPARSHLFRIAILTRGICKHQVVQHNKRSGHVGTWYLFIYDVPYTHVYRVICVCCMKH